MTRTRAQRRHNTQVKTSARKAIADRGDNPWIPGGCCGGKISLNGEAASCSRCHTEMYYERNHYRSLNDIRMDGWYQAHAEF